MATDLPYDDAAKTRGSIREGAPIYRPVEFEQIGPIAPADSAPNLGLGVIVGGVFTVRNPAKYPHPPQFDPPFGGQPPPLLGFATLVTAEVESGVLNKVTLVFDEDTIEDTDLVPTVLITDPAGSTYGTLIGFDGANRIGYSIPFDATDKTTFMIVKTMPGLFTTPIELRAGLSGPVTILP